MMESDKTKSKKRKANQANHVTIFTDPTTLVQPYKYSSHAFDVQEIDNVQRNNKPRTAAGQHSTTSTQSHVPLKPASLPGLITVNNLSSALISQQTSLLTNPGITIDMSLTQISDPNFRHIISQCVKLHVFRRCKFYNKEHHGVYNEKATSFCGIVLNYCNIVANEAWWYNTRKMIVITHTNHRNNCIKAMKLKFKGTSKKQNNDNNFLNTNLVRVSIYLCIEGCPKATPSQPFVTPHMSLYSGCKSEIEHLLRMRADVCHYCAILDMYASCIVSFRTWNDDTKMNRFCCTTDAKLFNAHVLSVSDEAFLLLVLINSGARWMAEIKRESGKVRAIVKLISVDAYFLKVFFHSIQKKKTWTEEQELAMPVSKLLCDASEHHVRTKLLFCLC
jgi:hypothetical protein